MATGILDGPALSGGAEADARLPSAPAIEQIYDAHFRFVWRCLRSLGVPDAALDDALQDVFVVVQRKVSAFEGRSQLSTWLYAIALRVARRYRSRACSESREVIEEDPVASANGESVLEQSDRLARARRALACLDDEKREVFGRAQVEPMPGPGIATITGAS